MTVKELLISCNTNTADITIFDKDHKIIFDDMIYLGFHCDNSKKILAAEVKAWGMTNFNSIDIYTDYDSTEEETIIATSNKEILYKTDHGYTIKDIDNAPRCSFPDMGDNDLAWGNAVRAWNIRNENHKIDYDTEH